MVAMRLVSSSTRERSPKQVPPSCFGFFIGRGIGLGMNRDNEKAERLAALQAKRMWTQAQAIEFAAKLEAILAPVGFHVGLTGSMLYGSVAKTIAPSKTKNDLDLIVYPHHSLKCDHKLARDVLIVFGMKLEFSYPEIRKIRQLGKQIVDIQDPDEKHVDSWSYEGRRVDIFWLA